MQDFCFGETVVPETMKLLTTAMGAKALVQEKEPEETEAKLEEIMADNAFIKIDPAKDTSASFFELPEDSADKYNLEKAKLKDGDVLLSSLNCGIVLSPEEVRVEENFIIIILNNNIRNHFVLYPGSRFCLYIKNIEGVNCCYKVFFSGVHFECGSSIFIVFHLGSSEE